MKDFKFYPKRLLILLSFILVIPIIQIIAHVADIHLPTGEEIAMMHELEPYLHKSDEIVERPHDGIDQRSEEEKVFDEQRNNDYCYFKGEKDDNLEDEIKNDN